jgi:glutathione S-transferase
LKGRPPGTKKSTDPDKKKRKRVARERDLCDVKIKITEYFDQDEYAEQVGHRPPGAENEATGAHQPTNSLDQNQQFFAQAQMMQRDINGWDIPPNLAQFTAASGPVPLPRVPLKRYYTFQRVNGNGGNGKGDGVAGPHKHTLEESDRVKKNSVLRWLAKCEKDSKKSQVSYLALLLSICVALQVWTSFACFAVCGLRLQNPMMPLRLEKEEIVKTHDVYMQRHQTTAAGSRIADHSHNVILMLTGNCTLHLFPSAFCSFVMAIFILPRFTHHLSRSSLFASLAIPKSPFTHPYLQLHPRIPTSVRFKMTDTNQGGDDSKKTYHKKATGLASTTVKNHSKEDDLKLYGSAFCPFVQRVWISLEHKSLPYQYIEVDPYRKPPSLLAVNPRGLVPALRHGPTWSTHESTVIMEYLEDLGIGPALLIGDAQTRATQRLWADHVNRNIIPCFYRLLQAQDQEKRNEHASEMQQHITKLVDAAHPTGPFFLGPHMSFVDVQFAPWMLRFKRVLGPYRGWPEAQEGSRWKSWLDAVEGEESVKRTTSGDELYLDSYERYAENREGTSGVADAVNSGRGLP